MQIKALLLFVAAAIAAPVDVALEERASVTCGSNTYTSNQVSAAVNAGCNGAGADGYPHQYNNYEGFDFPNASPYYEFPIKKSGVYTGGSPGADRVIYDRSCRYQGSITHTGASGNAFVGCSDTN